MGLLTTAIRFRLRRACLRQVRPLRLPLPPVGGSDPWTLTNCCRIRGQPASWLLQVTVLCAALKVRSCSRRTLNPSVTWEKYRRPRFLRTSWWLGYLDGLTGLHLYLPTGDDLTELLEVRCGDAHLLLPQELAALVVALPGRCRRTPHRRCRGSSASAGTY